MIFFLGILFAVTQGPNKCVIVRAFDLCSDGIFTDSDLRKFVLKHWCFKEMFYYWTYTTLYNGNNKYQEENYWETDQMLQ